MAGNDVELKAGINTGSLDSSLNATRTKLRRWAGSVATDMSRALRGAFAGLTDIAGFGGIAGFAAATKGVIDFEKRLVRLQVASRSTAKDMIQFKQSIFDVAKTKGVDPEELLGGIEKYVALTGNIGDARVAMDGFAKVAAATGSNFGDITTTAAALSQNMGIAAKEMEHAFDIMLVQGKSGAVELKDLAQITAGLTPQFATFGTKGTAGLAEMGAMLQVIRTGFGSSSEAATGMESLMTGLAKHAKDLRGIGVEVFDPKNKNQMRDLADISFDLIAKTKGNPELLIKLLGRAEGVRALLPLMRVGRGELQKMIDEGMKANELNKDFATVMKTPAMQLQNAASSIKEILSKAIVPHLPAIVSAFEKLGKLIGIIAENWKLIAAGIATFKVGGILGAGGAAFGGPAAGLLGAAGGVAGAAGGAGAAGSRIGAVIQGAGVGAILASTLGKDLPAVSQGAVVLANALAGLPGPIGKLVAVAADLSLVASNLIDAAQNAKREAIIKGRVGEFGVGEAKRLGLSEAPIVKGLGTEALTPAQREAAQGMLRTGIRLGAISKDTAAVGGFAVDTAKLKEELKKETDLSPGQRQLVEKGVLEAQRALTRDPELRRRATLEAGGVREAQMLGPEAPPLTIDAPQMGATITSGGQFIPKEIKITVKADPGFHAVVENDPAQRRR
jgi:TP901 family phage tail tape measure protein